MAATLLNSTLKLGARILAPFLLGVTIETVAPEYKNAGWLGTAVLLGSQVPNAYADLKDIKTLVVGQSEYTRRSSSGGVGQGEHGPAVIKRTIR